MKAANPAFLRKSLDIANHFARSGITFICVPVFNDEQTNEMIDLAASRLETLALESEANEKAQPSC